MVCGLKLISNGYWITIAVKRIFSEPCYIQRQLFILSLVFFLMLGHHGLEPFLSPESVSQYFFHLVLEFLALELIVINRQVLLLI